MSESAKDGTVAVWRRIAKGFDRCTGVRLSALDITDLYYGDHMVQTTIDNILAGEWDDRPAQPEGTEASERKDGEG